MSPVCELRFGAQRNLAANGQWQKAADLLDERAHNLKNQWLAGRLTQRARDIRKAQGPGPQLVSDATRLLEFAAHALREQPAIATPFL